VRNSSESSGLFRSGTRLCVLIGPGVSTISRQDGRGCGSYLMYAFVPAYICMRVMGGEHPCDPLRGLLSPCALLMTSTDIFCSAN